MAEGDIDAVLDSFTFNGSYCDTPELIRIYGNVYAIVYTGPDSDGFVCTVSIDAAGNIGGSVIDSYEFDTNGCSYPCIIHIYGNVYAIAYSDFDTDGRVCTITIDPAGNITASKIDALEFEGTLCTEPRIIHVTGEIYAVAYRSSGADGWVCTFTINAAGGIGGSVIDTLEWDSVNGYENNIIHVSGDIFAVVYRGTNADGFIVTFTIDAAGDIGGSVIDKLEFDTDQCYNPSFINIFENIFAVAYLGTDSDGYLITISIDGSGNIGAAVIDSLEFDILQGEWPHIRHISGDVYAIAYNGANSDGWICTVTIEQDGNIGASIIDSLEFDPDKADTPTLIFVSNDVYAIAYQDTNDHGVIKTVGIETLAPGGPKHLPLMGIG